MNIKKLIALLLCVVCVLSTATLLASCNNTGTSDNGENNGNSNNGTGDVDTSVDTSNTVPGFDVSEIDYDGYEFSIFICNRSARTPNDFAADDKDESAMGIASYKRTLRMEENYGVKIYVEEFLNSNVDTMTARAQSEMDTQLSSNTNIWDMGIFCTYAAAPLTTAGYLYDLNAIPYLDLSKTYWDQTIVEGLTLADSIYYVCGDISTTVNDYMYCTVFNKDMYKQYVQDGTDVYELVAEGDWSLDDLSRLSKLVTDGDKNGDGQYTCVDKFGLMTWYDEMYASVQAAGGRVAKITDDGKIELCLNTERNFDVMIKYCDIQALPTTINFQSTTANNVPNPQMTGERGWPAIFSEGDAMFFMTLINEVDRFRDSDIEYGILPNPMYDKAQEDWYCTFSAGLASFVCVPSYQEDIDRTGTIIELLAWEGVTTITPGYYDKTLKGKLVKDDESIDSLTIILDNKFADIGHYYRVGKLNTAMWSVSRNGTAGSFASQYAANLPAAEADINSINEAMQNLKLAN